MKSVSPFKKITEIRPASPDHFYWHNPGVEVANTTNGTNHLHWLITGFTKWDDQGNMIDTVRINVEAPDEQTAIARAAKLITRPAYRVSEVSEACSLDKELKDGKC